MRVAFVRTTATPAAFIQNCGIVLFEDHRHLPEKRHVGLLPLHAA